MSCFEEHSSRRHSRKEALDSETEQIDHLMHIDCPRCGYDMRGVIASWRESCPLEGVCSECGIVFSWCEVILAGAQLPLWLIEFSSWKRVPKACLTTLARSFWPARFWKTLRIEHPLRWKRLALYLLAQTVILLLIGICIQSIAAVIVRWHTQAWLEPYMANLPAEIARREAEITRLETVIAETRIGLDHDRLKRTLDVTKLVLAGERTQIAKGPIQLPSYAAAIWESIVAPWRTKSTLATNAPSGYPPPSEIIPRAIRFCGGSWWSTHDTVRDRVLLSFLASCGVFLLMPLSMLLIPLTLRRFRIRWTHFVRITVYGLPILGVVLVAIMVCLVWSAFSAANYVRQVERAAAIAAWGVPVLGSIWWWLAIKHYLRIPNSWVLVIMLSGMCLLMAAAIRVFVLQLPGV